MKKIVFSDIDGTLLSSENKITPLTEKAIRDLMKKGIPFVIISARSPAAIYPLLDAYDIKCPIIAYNGAVILDESGNILYSKGIKKSDAKRIIEFIEDNLIGNVDYNLTWAAYSLLDEWIVRDKNDPRIIRSERKSKTKATQGTVDLITHDEVNRILCLCNPDKITEIEEVLKGEFPDFYIVKSYHHLLEIQDKSVNKVNAIKFLCSLWDIDLKNAAAFGDYYNDIEMLETVGHGFLMGNAPDDLKEMIDKHTCDNDHDGIYHALAGLGWI